MQPRRLTVVRAIISTLVVWTLAMGGAPALAQAEPTTLEATAGAEGWVASGRPISVTAIVESEILFVGDLVVRYSGVEHRQPVEIPAGTSKTYEAILPEYVVNARIVAALYPTGSDDPIGQVTIRPQLPDDELLVGVVDDADFETRLGGQRTVPGDLPITAVTSDGLHGLDPLGYLVVGDQEPSESALAWVRDGGRLVATESVILEIAGLDPVADGRFRLGDGLVLAAEPTDDEWPGVFTPVSLDVASQDLWSAASVQMGRAAANSGATDFTDLPWLLIGLVGYVLLVGPVNLIILRRRKRAELAWISIPALALLGALAFWVVGRQQLTDSVVRHATVVVSEAEGSSIERTVILAAGAAGEYSVGIQDGIIHPASTQLDGLEPGMAGSITTATIEGTTAHLTLPQLGVASLGVRQESARTTIRGEVVEREGGNVQIRVTNDSAVPYEVWGATMGDRAVVGTGELAPGASGTVRLVDGQPFFEGGNLGDAIVNVRGFLGQSDYEVLHPMGWVGGQRIKGGVGVFGFSPNAPVDLDVGGSPRVVDGPFIAVSSLSDELRIDSASLVAITGNRWTENYGNGVTVDADSVMVSFDAPVARTTFAVRAQGGWGLPADGIEVFDPAVAEWVAAALGDDLDASRFVTPSGEVFVRLFPRDFGNNEFEREPMVINTARIEWSS